MIARPDVNGGSWALVTVTYNSAETLRRSWGDVELADVRWIVVDNASHDDSAGVARDLGADVIVLDRNVGFGAANNIGMQRVDRPWLAFVNPDVRIGSVNGLSRLAEVSEANRSLVAPQLMNPDGSEQPNARGLPFLVDKMANRSVPLPGSQLRNYARTGMVHPTFVAWVIGAALAGPTEVLREIGGWDERFFLYYEDHDIGLRAWEHGVPVVVDPAVRWEHQWQRATRRPALSPWGHEIRSGRAFYRKYPYLRGRRAFATAPRTLDNLVNCLWSAAREPSSSADSPRREHGGQAGLAE